MTRRNIVWGIPLLCLVTSPLWYTPVSNFLAPREGVEFATGQGGKDIQNFSMDGVILYQYKNDAAVAIIRADQVSTGKESEKIFLKKVDSDLYDDAGNLTRITSDRGIYNSKLEILTLTKNVVVQKDVDQQQLNTELLVYNGKARTVNCPGNTLITTKDGVIDGGNLLYTIADGSYDIGGGVRCSFNGFLAP